MPRTIDVEPGDLGVYTYNFGDNLSLVITDQFNENLRTSVARSVVQPEMDIDQTLRSLHESIDYSAAGVFASRYTYEREWDSGNKPLLNLLGELALTEEVIPELIPSEPYLDDLHRQVDGYHEGIEALKTLHDLWPPKVFEYLLALDSVTSGQETEKGDMALEIVRQMSEDTKQLTLSPDHPEGLLLITHLPHYPRQLTRRLLVGSHITARVERALGEEITPDEEGLLQTMRRYYALESLHGQQWEARNLPFSEAGQVEIARYSAEQLATLATLQQEADKQAGERFKEVWTRETHALSEILDAVGHSSTTRHWQLTDIGHAFEGFSDRGLQKAFRQGYYSKMGQGEPTLHPEKSGRRAVILEDDDSQRTLWRETVQNSTSFTTEDGLTFATPENMDDVIDDPSIGLFVLDIQNGDDATAGVRVGEEILRRRHQNLVNEKDSSNKLLKTKIIIWSASFDAVEQASTHFMRLVEESMPEVGYAIGGNLGGFNSEIRIEVRRKVWHSFTDIE